MYALAKPQCTCSPNANAAIMPVCGRPDLEFVDDTSAAHAVLHLGTGSVARCCTKTSNAVTYRSLKNGLEPQIIEWVIREGRMSQKVDVDRL